VGRDPHDPARLKPNAWTLTRALDQLDLPASAAVFIGDAVTDIEAARGLGMPSIGYANRPAKTDALRDAGADAIVTSMLHVGDVMSAVGQLR
jgi:beta-phosphoglucomutase-like phosphatase (HAD superfamily)